MNQNIGHVPPMDTRNFDMNLIFFIINSGFDMIILILLFKIFLILQEIKETMLDGVDSKPYRIKAGYDINGLPLDGGHRWSKE